MDIKEWIWRTDKSCSWMGKLNITDVNSLQIYLNLKTQEKFFEEPDNLIIRFIRKNKRPRMAKIILKHVKEGTTSSRYPELFWSSGCKNSGTGTGIHEDNSRTGYRW